MSEAFSIDRVIAALDANSHELDLLSAAADMAARLNTDVAGLFIEDENLLRLWTLPAARHITLAPRGGEVPTAEQIEAELRALAAQAETALRAAAARKGVRWTFRVVRGRPERELSEGIMTKDLVVVGRSRVLPGPVPVALSSPLQDAVRRLAQSTLHISRVTTLAHPIIIVAARSRLVDRTIAAALRIADPTTHDIHILLIGEPAATERTRDEIARRLTTAGYAARVISTERGSSGEIARALSGVKGDVLVVAADVPALRERDEFVALLERAGLPVMIVRA